MPWFLKVQGVAMTKTMLRFLLIFIALAAPFFHAKTAQTGSKEPAKLRVRIIGLFAKERTADLQVVLDKWQIKMLELDFNHAEGLLEFDAAKVLAGVKPPEYTARLDEMVRNASQGTFGLKPPSSTPKNQLKRIEIPVLGLDCKACCLAAYEIIARLDGVEQGTASFKDGRISALIDPKRIQISQMEAALKERGVTINK